MVIGGCGDPAGEHAAKRPTDPQPAWRRLTQPHGAAPLPGTVPEHRRVRRRPSQVRTTARLVS